MTWSQSRYEAAEEGVSTFGERSKKLFNLRNKGKRLKKNKQSLRDSQEQDHTAQHIPNGSLGEEKEKVIEKILKKQWPQIPQI